MKHLQRQQFSFANHDHQLTGGDIHESHLAEQIGLKWEDPTIDPKLVNTAGRNTKQ